jgi:ParB family chromosome partitioning protein
MNRHSIPITDIQVLDRQRIDLGDIPALAESIARYGLIQPIVINQENRLIAGGRRLAALKSLNATHADVVFRETLTADELHELELEENVQRKDMTWQERCLNIARIHRLKQKRGALEGSLWGQRETGAMLGLSGAHVNYNLTIAAELQRDPASPLWKCESLSDAWRVVLRQREEAALAALAAKTSVAPTIKPLPPKDEETLTAFTSAPATPLATQSPPTEDVLRKERERYYSNPHNPAGSFEDYWRQRQEAVNKSRRTVYLSNRLYQGDSIALMSSSDFFEVFDHIITDPPYGIDMDNLAQENQGMADIDFVEKEHEVEDNEDLLQRFFPAAYAALKPNGFCVAWCDAMQWQLMYDSAVAAGFKVQRWPLVWVKPVAMNNAAQYNYTKTTEFAMVCRKGNATLVKPQPTCVVSAGHDWMRKAFGHPFVKPQAVWNFILQAVSIEGQLILDPFAGRGSSIVSALASGRHAYGIECNVGHFNALLENVKQYYLSLDPNVEFK